MDIFSFDIFDTTITRYWYKPTDVFLLVGIKLADLGICHLDAEEFSLLRTRVEAELRTNNVKEEITLIEIYDELASRLRWSTEKMSLAMAAEQNIEIKSVLPIAEIKKRVNQLISQKERVVFISDTYFPQKTLLSMLKSCGIDSKTESVFASSEFIFTKRSITRIVLVYKTYGKYPCSREFFVIF